MHVADWFQLAYSSLCSDQREESVDDKKGWSARTHITLFAIATLPVIAATFLHFT